MVAPEKNTLPESLYKRLGAGRLQARLELQALQETQWASRGVFPVGFRRPRVFYPWLARILRWTSLYERGYHNYLDLQVVEHKVKLKGLAAPFRGYRILHLSDLHFDLDRKLVKVILENVRGLRYDLAVITGDFRNAAYTDNGSAFRDSRRLAAALRAPIFAVLGNHDTIEMVPVLESMGIRILLNESTPLVRQAAELHLAGVDDPVYFETHDLDQVVPPGGRSRASILLAHSPSLYQAAARKGFSLYLCGHTHGGQICLPRGIAIARRGHCPSRMLAGHWKHRHMWGYTSRGTGATGIPVRFFCPPEITLHTLC